MQKKFTTLPNLGRNFHLDFTNVKSDFQLHNLEKVTELFKNALQKVNLPVIQSHHYSSEQGLILNFILKTGHLNYASFTESNSCTIDLFYSQQKHADNDNNDKSIELAFEDFVSDVIGFQSQTTNIGFNRGKYTQLSTNELPDKNEIFHNVKFVHKEKTLFQDLRIYDTPEMGRVLILDGMVQISNELEDNYTVDLQKEIVNQNSKHILIIGGGDLLIANYILKHYQNVEKVTLCEIDKGVIDSVQKYFEYGQKEVQEALKSGRLEIVINDGAKFAKEQAEKYSEIYNGVIVDCSDSWNEGSPALSLTTVEFYSNLKKLLTQGGGVSQQLSHPSLIPKFQEAWKQAGLSNFKDINCVSPEYGGYLPLGCAYKN